MRAQFIAAAHARFLAHSDVVAYVRDCSCPDSRHLREERASRDAIRHL